MTRNILKKLPAMNYTNLMRQYYDVVYSAETWTSTETSIVKNV